MLDKNIERLLFSLILFAYLILGALFAWRIPAWQAPDEPAHYNYIAQVATGDLLPKIEMGDWDNNYLETLKAEDFAPELLEDFAAIQYENHQPPLYYWLASPFYLLGSGSLFFIRFYSVLLGSISISLAYFIGKEIFPNRPQIALSAMAFIAFLPQNLHILASVNNDALAGVWVALMLFLAIRSLKGKDTSAWQLGLVLGLAFITKTTAYFMAAVMLFVLFLRWWQSENRQISNLFRNLLSFGIPATLFALLYWGRNILTYGFPDFLGFRQHDRVVIGQLRTSEYLNQVGAEYWNIAFNDSFNSFWGQFGWMEARLFDALPFTRWLIIAFVLVAILGLFLAMFRRKPSEENSPKAQIWLSLSLVILLTFAMYIYYNLSFVQFQGRYLFTALIPLSLLLALGIDTWRKLLKLEGLFAYFSLLPFLAFAFLDAYLIWRVIPCAVGCFQ